MDRFEEEQDAGHRTAGRGHSEDFWVEVEAGRGAVERLRTRLEEEQAAGRRATRLTG